MLVLSNVGRCTDQKPIAVMVLLRKETLASAVFLGTSPLSYDRCELLPVYYPKSFAFQKEKLQ